MTARISARASRLSAERVPFVRATVVRAQVPTSARAGDDAIVLSDGSIDGFVGGQCAESSVRTAALGALADGAAVLLRVLPEGDVHFPDTPGAQVVVNDCLSGGALEIFLEPVLPPPMIGIVGHSPIADAVAAMCEILGYGVSRPSAASDPGDVDGPRPRDPVVGPVTALVVASHGRDELESIRAAVEAGVGHIALVASRRRGSALLDELGVTDAQRARISTPAGLEIGARTAPEVAVSILAEVIAAIRSGAVSSVGPTAAAMPAPISTADPVCGMTVTVVADTPHLGVDGGSVWFCSSHCRDVYAQKVGP